MPNAPAPKIPLFGLQPIEFLALQETVLCCAFRALLANHPEPQKVRATFDQLLGQIQASPAVAGSSQGQSEAVRSFAATLFQPPVTL